MVAARDFSGTLDGSGYAITGLMAEGERAGLFAAITDGFVKNLRLENGSASGQAAGMLAGEAKGAALVGLTVSGGRVTGEDYVGGLIGRLDSGCLVSNISVSDLHVSGSRFVGGVAGDAASVLSDIAVSRANIESSYLYTVRSGNNPDTGKAWTDEEKEDGKRAYVGGVSGRNTAALKTGAVTEATVRSQGGAVGGVTGAALGAVSDFTATAFSVEGSYLVGGAAGYASADIKNCRVESTGEIRSTVNNQQLTGLSGTGTAAGGVVGRLEDAQVSDSTADTDLICGYGEAGGVIGSGMGATFRNVTAYGTLKNYGSASGGVVGSLLHSVEKQYTGGVSYVDVQGVNQSIGGLVGRVGNVESGGDCPDFTFVDCYAAGSTRLLLTEENRDNATNNNYAYWGALYGYQAKSSFGSEKQHFENSGVIFDLNLTGDYQKVEVFNLGDGTAEQAVTDNGDGSSRVRITAKITASMGMSEDDPYGCMANYGGIFVRITKADGSYVYASNMDRTKATFVDSLDIDLQQVASYPADELAGLEVTGDTVTVQTASQLEHIAWLINGYIYGEQIGSLPVTDVGTQRQLASIDLKLAADMDLTQSSGVFGGHNFYGIGWSSLMPYLGCLDGGGHTLTVDINCPYGYEIGVLGAVSSNAGGMSATKSTSEVKNMTIKGRIAGASRVGVVGFHDNYAPSTLYDYDRNSFLVVSNVDNYAEVYGVSLTGSILGATSSTHANYWGDAQSGTGEKYVRATLNDCHAYGCVYGAVLEADGPRYISNNLTGGVGGLVGVTGRKSSFYGAVTMNGCSAEADVVAPNLAHVGGLVGCNNGHIYFKGENAMNANVSGGDKVGALTGQTYYGYEFANEKASLVIRPDVSVKAKGTAGGITGVMTGPGVIENFTVNGTLTISPPDSDATVNYYAGGVVGQLTGNAGNAVLRNLTNNCDVLFNALPAGDGYEKERDYKVEGITAAGAKSNQSIYIGGIVGRLEATYNSSAKTYRVNTLANVANNGDVVAFPLSAVGTTYIYAGGIVGDSSVNTSDAGTANLLDNPTNTGRVLTAADVNPEAEGAFWQHVGGYFGRVTGGVTFQNLAFEEPVNVQATVNGSIQGSTDNVYNRVGGLAGSMTSIARPISLSGQTLGGRVVLQNNLSADGWEDTISTGSSDYAGGWIGEFSAGYAAKKAEEANIGFQSLTNNVQVDYNRSGDYAVANAGENPASKSYNQTVMLGGFFGSCSFSLSTTTPGADFALANLTNNGAVNYRAADISANLQADFVPVNNNNLSNITLTQRQGGIAGYLGVSDSATAAGTANLKLESLQNNAPIRAENQNVVCEAVSTERNQTDTYTGGNRYSQVYAVGGVIGYFQSSGSNKAAVEGQITGLKNTGDVYLDSKARFHSDRNSLSQNSFSNEGYAGGLFGYFYNTISGASGATSHLTLAGLEGGADVTGAFLNTGRVESKNDTAVTVDGVLREQLPSVSNNLLAAGMAGRFYNNVAQNLVSHVEASNFFNRGEIVVSGTSGYTTNSYTGGAVGQLMGVLSNTKAGSSITFTGFRNEGDIRVKSDGPGSQYNGGLIGRNAPNDSRTADYALLDAHFSDFVNSGDLSVENTGESLTSYSAYSGGVMGLAQQVTGLTGEPALSGLSSSGKQNVQSPAGPATHNVYAGGILGHITGQEKSAKTLGGRMESTGALRVTSRRSEGSAGANLYTGGIAGYATNLLPDLAADSLLNTDIDIDISGRLRTRTATNGTRITAYGGGAFGYLNVPSVLGEAVDFTLKGLTTHGSITVDQGILHNHQTMEAERFYNEDVTYLGGVIGSLNRSVKDQSENSLTLSGLQSDVEITQHLHSDVTLTGSDYDASLIETANIGGIVGQYAVSNPNAQANKNIIIQSRLENLTYSGSIYYLNSSRFNAVRNGAKSIALNHTLRSGGILGYYSQSLYFDFQNDWVMVNCQNEGSLKTDYNVVSQNTGSAENNARTETFNAYTGGIAGLLGGGVASNATGASGMALQKLTNTGAVSLHSADEMNNPIYLGGVVGQISGSLYTSSASQVKMEDLTNTGAVTADFTGYGSSSIGGAVGQANLTRTVTAGAADQPVLANRLNNSGNIIVRQRSVNGTNNLYTGGVMGYTPYHFEAVEIGNTGDVYVALSGEKAGVTSAAYTGGLFGILNASYNAASDVVWAADLTDGVNNGRVEASILAAPSNVNAYTGGAVGHAGYSNGWVTLNRVRNNGDVKASGNEAVVSSGSQNAVQAGSVGLETGGLCGRFYGYTTANEVDKIAECVNTGSVTVDGSGSTVNAFNVKTGGLAGYQRAGVVEGSWNSGSLLVDLSDLIGTDGKSISSYTGGLVGHVENALAAYTGSYNAGGVTLLLDRIQAPGVSSHNHYAAGLTGYLSSASMEQCFNVGNVLLSSNEAEGHANYTAFGGGVTGYAPGGRLENDYNAGNVTINGTINRVRAGGVSGYNETSTTMQSCYHAGQLDVVNGVGSSSLGAVCGTSAGTMLSNYYDADRNTLAGAGNKDVEGKAEPLGNAALTGGSLPDGFDENIWTVKEGYYPALKKTSVTDAASIGSAGTVEGGIFYPAGVEKYTLTYTAGKGTGEATTQTYFADATHGFLATIAPSSDYTKPDGYTGFLWWNTKPDGSGTVYRPGDSVDMQKTGSMTLYAIWTRPLTVSFDFNAGDEVGVTPQAVVTSSFETADLKEAFTVIPQREGYDFLGWSRNPAALTPGFSLHEEGGLTPEALTLADENVTLYAVWSRAVSNDPTYAIYIPLTVTVGAESEVYVPQLDTGYALEVAIVSVNGQTEDKTFLLHHVQQPARTMGYTVNGASSMDAFQALRFSEAGRQSLQLVPMEGQSLQPGLYSGSLTFDVTCIKE